MKSIDPALERRVWQRIAGQSGASRPPEKPKKSPPPAKPQPGCRCAGKGRGK